jgi:hypothetical protein
MTDFKESLTRLPLVAHVMRGGDQFQNLIMKESMKHIYRTIRTVFVPVAAALLAWGFGLPLCGAGSTPVENLLPQGTMQGDLNVGGHNVVNAGTVRAANVIASNSLTSPSDVPLLLGPANTNFVVMGDSITAGPDGLPQYASSSFAATMQGLGMALAGGTTVYNLGLPGEHIGDMLGQYNGATGSTPVTTTVTTTSGSTSATIGSATGVSAGMSIGSANLAPNTLITAITGTTITLSRSATATGSGVTCSIATPVQDTVVGTSFYPGSAANQWADFNNTAHQLSYAVSGLPTYFLLLAGTNDIAVTGNACTVTTTSGSNSATISGLGAPALSIGCVITGANVPSASPPYITAISGSTITLSQNAIATGSMSATAWIPHTSLAAAESSFTSLVADAHSDGDTTANNGGVIAMTLLPRGNSTTTGGIALNVVLTQFNAWLKSGGSGADYVFDTNGALPAFGAATSSPYYYYLDQLHLSFIGSALLGRYIDQQFFDQIDTSALAWNPFAPNALPSSWLSSNAVLANQSTCFQPNLGEVTGAEFSISSGSATATINSGTTAGIYPGMYAACPGFAVGVQPSVTRVASVTSTTVTLTGALSATNANIYMAFSWSPFVGALNDQGDFIIGAANNLNGPNPCNVVFMASGDYFSPGLIWQNVSGAGEWSITAPTSGSGDMYIQNANGAVKLDLNSGGYTNVTGGLNVNGATALTGTLSVAGGSAATPLVISSTNSTSANWTFFDSSIGSNNPVYCQVGEGSGSNNAVLLAWRNAGGSGSSSNYGGLGMNDMDAIHIYPDHGVYIPTGPLGLPFKTGSASYTAVFGMNVFTGSASSQTVTLPAPSSSAGSSNQGSLIFFKNQASVAVTVVSNSGSQIVAGGGTSASASITVASGADALLWSDGSYWNQQ